MLGPAAAVQTCSSLNYHLDCSHFNGDLMAR